MEINNGESVVVFNRTVTALIHVTAKRMKIQEGELVTRAILLYVSAVDDGIHPDNQLIRKDRNGLEERMTGWKGEYYENQEDDTDGGSESEMPALRGHHPVKAQA